MKAGREDDDDAAAAAADGRVPLDISHMVRVVFSSPFI